MRSVSRSPQLSNRQSSTFVAWAENSEKLVPRPSQLAPRGCGKPSLIREFSNAGTILLPAMNSIFSVSQAKRTSRCF